MPMLQDLLAGPGRRWAPRFLASLESRLGAEGQFYLNSGQPIRAPYAFRDELTGEQVHLWRTVADVNRQSFYATYRKIEENGLLEYMREAKPHLFTTTEKDRRFPNVRAYDIPTLLADQTTNLICGRGVEIKTKIPAIDDGLKELKLEQTIRRCVRQASVFEFVGAEVFYDSLREALDVRIIPPDNLYLIYDDANQDALVCIAKRIFVPITAVPGWMPVSKSLQSREGLPHPVDNASKTTDTANTKGSQRSSQMHNVTQDGFIYEERHYRGWIEHSFYAVSANRILCEVPLHLYDRNLARTPVVFTGMRDFAITIFSNSDQTGRARSDWRTILGPVLDFCERATKNGQLVDRYSAPKAIIPQTHIQVDPYTGQAKWGAADSDVIIARPTDKLLPSYLQPNANFDAPKQDLDFSLSMIGVLSQMRFAIDPTVLDEADSGVALKLKMAPAILRVQPARQAHIEATQTLVFNILSAIEYHSAQAKREESGSMAWAGILDEQMRAVFSEKAAQMRAGLRISVKRGAAMLQGVTLADPDAPLGKPGSMSKQPIGAPAGPNEMEDVAEGEELEDATASDSDMMDDISPDGSEGDDVEETDVEEEGDAEDDVEELTPVSKYGADSETDSEMKFGDNVVKKSDGVDPVRVKITELQRALQAVTAVDNLSVVAAGTIEVRLTPGLPQDMAEATERVRGATMSLLRMLTEYDGMSQTEAQDEIKRISSDGAMTQPASIYGGGNNLGTGFNAGGDAQQPGDAEDPADGNVAPDESDKLGDKRQAFGSEKKEPS